MTVQDGDGPAPEAVRYGTAVRVPLWGLPSEVKRRIWRDRQVQNQAYNWGVEYALGVFHRGERIPSPRNHSAPLTQFRRGTGSEHSVLLQRGGFWCAVEAVKKWSKRRDQLLYTRRKASEGTDAAMDKLGAAVERLADAETLPAQVGLMGEALALCRDHHRRRVELADSGEGAALHLRPSPTDPELAQLAADGRAEQIGEASEAADKALELFNAALKLLRAAINSAGGTDKTRKRLRDLADKAHKSAASEAKADKRLLAHIARGEMRLFRSRRDIEQCSGPALVLFEGCTVRAGVLRLPGGTEIPLPDGIATIEDVLEAHQGQSLTWGGAVHIVDVTDKAGKVTRRTTPAHRKYHAHFLCRAFAPTPQPVTAPEHSLGTDWGVVVPLVCSDGSAYGRHASPDQQQASQKRHAESVRLQQSMSTKTEGSRRHARQRRRRQKLLSKNTNVRTNHQRHVAKSVVTTPEVRQVVLEDTKASNMTASAEGTKAFPTRGSGAKRGLNRSIAETAPARQTTFIERAAVIGSVSTVRVNPAYTSLTCFVCGERGERETQALFRCPECGLYTHADVQASLNTNEAGNPGLYPSVRDVTYGGRDSRHKTLEHAVGVFLDTVDVDGSVTNKYARAA